MGGKLVWCLGTLGFALHAVSAGAQPARTASAPRPVRVVGDFQGDKGAATNLSGVACAPESEVSGSACSSTTRAARRSGRGSRPAL